MVELKQMSNRDLNIYLAGKMNGLTYEEMNNWRVKAKDTLLDYTSVTTKRLNVVNPCDYYNFEMPQHQSEREVMEFDLRLVKKSDIIVVNLDGINTSIGTCIECYVANSLDIPVIALGTKEQYEKVHPWIQCCITRYEKNEFSLSSYIKNFYC